MKKGRILHPQLSHVVASMGHTDGLVIADCGLPIPEGVERVDLALAQQIPTFLQVLDSVLSELEVEQIVLAEEMRTYNPEMLQAIELRLSGIPVQWVSHETFKTMTASSKAVVRSGECSPYANVILKSGVIF
jgi:D-ribose pyranase